MVDVHKINAKKVNDLTAKPHSETGWRQLFRLVSKKLYIVRASDILYLEKRFLRSDLYEHFRDLAEKEITKENHIFSRTRTTIESAFYGNNVVDVASVEQAYRLAEKSSATIVTDLPIIHTKELGLPDDAR